MKIRFTYYFLLLVILGSVHISAQTTKRVLFLGNSYTYANNLPQLLSDVAASTGNLVIFDSNTPGGYYLGQHVTNPVSLALIAQGNWDNVVLQDQSMALAYPYYYMNGISYSLRLDSIIKADNQCAQTMFYSTWGRKNGDQFFCAQPQCPFDSLFVRTYFEMDSTIESHYKVFADSARAEMSPVGAVWRYIRQNHPSVELFTSDGSHPSPAGSYAAACCFYAAIFRSDPTQITFNSTLSVADANNIKLAAKQIVYNNLPRWNIGLYDHLLDSSCRTPAGDNNEYWTVSPNPVNNVLYINFPAGSVQDKISIYNALGALVKEVEVTQATSIDFNAFSGGIYFVRSAAKQLTVKVLKM
ncbi:MAG: T9SS type A sorting domain-containing protein [Bacteroidia bacterium]